jgi:MFS family permease
VPGGLFGRAGCRGEDASFVRAGGEAPVRVAVLALLSVVFLDIMNQGLVFPILNTIVMNPDRGILPNNAATATRELDYGLLMGAFYLCWFFGAAYISRISDMVGRKQGILVCLLGNLSGFALTIVSLEINSFWLLFFARALAGFTAGNQPIAQAALVDISKDDIERTRNMGLILVAVSGGLVAGPLIGGLLSDKGVLGQYASIEMPFFFVSGLIVISINLIFFFFHNARTDREPFVFRPLEVFLTLWEAAKRPTIAKLAIVFFFAQIALNAYYIFMANYFYSRFHFDTLENSLSLVVLGVGLGFASAFLVTPVNKRFGRTTIILGCLAMMAVSGALSIVNPWPIVAYLLILPFIMAFAVYYPTILTMFSTAVDDSEQGWVMGVTVALFTLGAGLVSLLSGDVMAVNIHLPFIFAVVSALIGMLLVFMLWRGEDIRVLDR